MVEANFDEILHLTSTFGNIFVEYYLILLIFFPKGKAFYKNCFDKFRSKGFEIRITNEEIILFFVFYVLGGYLNKFHELKYILNSLKIKFNGIWNNLKILTINTEFSFVVVVLIF